MLINTLVKFNQWRCRKWKHSFCVYLREKIDIKKQQFLAKQWVEEIGFATPNKLQK